jgi:hypothetical protein
VDSTRAIGVEKSEAKFLCYVRLRYGRKAQRTPPRGELDGPQNFPDRQSAVIHFFTSFTSFLGRRGNNFFFTRVVPLVRLPRGEILIRILALAHVSLIVASSSYALMGK